MSNRINVFYFSFLFLTLFISYSQEPIYKHYGVDEGLPSSQIYDVLQDKEGYIWFATDKGISRFNGYEFENFDTNDGLPGNVVLRFYPQKNGEIWAYAFHAKSLFYFNQKFNGFKSYTNNAILNKELNLNNSIVKSLSVDEFRNVKIGGNKINGILSINKAGEANYKYSNENFFDLEKNLKKYLVVGNSNSENPFYFITANKKIAKSSYSKQYSKTSHIDVSWLIPHKKAILMDGESIEIVDQNKQIKKIESKKMSLGIKIINSTEFFVGYYNGGAKIINIKTGTYKDYLQGKSVTKFLIDHEGGYWFTTLNSGVYYVKNPSISFFKGKKTSLHINSLAKKNDTLLIGYNNGGFAKLKSNSIIQFQKSKSNSYPSLVEYDSILNKTYVYNNNTLKINGKGFLSSPIKLSEPTHKTSIFSSNRSAYFNINEKKYAVFPFRVQDVSIWDKDTLIATPFGVYKKNNDSIIELSKKTKLLGYRSDDIDVSFNGEKFYVATQGAGVVVYGKEIFNISAKNGLTSNIVNEIFIENDSTIWACTNKGLNRIVFHNDNFIVSTFNKNKGLISNEIEDIEIIKDTIYIATKEGLCYFPKKEINLISQQKVYLKIKQIKVNDKPIHENKKSTLSYDKNKITFFVEGVSYANTNLVYQYRLKEVDKNWSSTKNRNISFPNLKSGNYTFQVKTCKKGKCNRANHLEYSFIIKPPFWKSIWFYSLSFLALSGIFYSFFKIRVLTYNKDVTREIMRLLLKKLKPKEKYIEVRINGEDIKIHSSKILYVKSSGNYLDIITLEKKYTIRCKIADFIALTPDSLEFLRVHRSYIVRIDKITSKSKKSVTIENTVIPVGETYLSQVKNIHF